MLIPILLFVLGAFALASGAITGNKSFLAVALLLAIFGAALAIGIEGAYQKCLDDLPKGFDYTSAVDQANMRGEAPPHCERWPW